VLLCAPVARIDQSTCDQIRPGMTLDEAEAIIGAIPGWYDRIWGIQTNSPGYKGYKPYWVGSQGEIILELDQQNCIAEANFYPGQVIDRSVPNLVWERLTRNAFGTGRTDLVVEASKGFLLGLIMSYSLVMVALLWRLQGLIVWAYGLCLVGAILSLAALIVAAGVAFGGIGHGPYFLLGASSSGLITFVLGGVLSGKRKQTEPAIAAGRPSE